MNLTTDLDRRWSLALSQSPKSIMVQGDLTSMAEDQSVDVNQLESQAETWIQPSMVELVHHLNQ